MPLIVTQHAVKRLKSRFGFDVDKERTLPILEWMIANSTASERTEDGSARFLKPKVWAVVVCQKGAVLTVYRAKNYRPEVAEKYLNRLRREVLG